MSHQGEGDSECRDEALHGPIRIGKDRGLPKLFIRAEIAHISLTEGLEN